MKVSFFFFLRVPHYIHLSPSLPIKNKTSGCALHKSKHGSCFCCLRNISFVRSSLVCPQLCARDRDKETNYFLAGKRYTWRTTEIGPVFAAVVVVTCINKLFYNYRRMPEKGISFFFSIFLMTWFIFLPSLSYITQQSFRQTKGEREDNDDEMRHVKRPLTSFAAAADRQKKKKKRIGAQ